MEEVWIVTDYQVRGVYSSLKKAKNSFTKNHPTRFSFSPSSGTSGLNHSVQVFVGDNPMSSFTITKHQIK